MPQSPHLGQFPLLDVEVTKLSTRGLDDADLVGAGVVPVSGRPLILRPKLAPRFLIRRARALTDSSASVVKRLVKFQFFIRPSVRGGGKTHVSQSRAGHWKKM